MTEMVRKTSLYENIKLLQKGFGKYRRKLLMLVGLGFISGLLEAVGVNALIPLFSFVTGGSGQADDFISETIASLFAFLHIPYNLTFLLLFIVGLFFVRAGALLWANYIRIKIAADYEKIVRTDVLKKTFKARWSLLLKQKLGYLETLLMTNVRYSERLLSTLSNSVILFAGWLMYLLVAINISVPITLFTVGLGIVLLVVFVPFLNRTRQYSKEVEKINRDTAHHINQNVVGMKTVKSLSVDDRVSSLGGGFFNSLKKLRIKIEFLKFLPTSLMQPIGIVFIVSVFAFSYKATDFNLAAFAAIIYLVQRMSLYTQQMQSQLHYVNEALPYLKELVQFEEEAVKNVEDRGGNESFNFEKELSFNNVSFMYPNKKEVFNHLNFKIQCGDMVGVIGPSGSGKTTIVDLLLRLFDPKEGKIKIDGIDIKEIDVESWRKNIGYVSQDIFLLNASIADNIRFYNETITDEDITNAIGMANAQAFVEQLPEGIDTLIGERGVELSAGQRQRIVIARALAQKPKILILDEATSALDSESEEQIKKAIDQIKGSLTIVVIAHRLSTVMSSDELIVLGNDNLVESGKPEELLKDSNSYFARVYKGNNTENNEG